MDVMETVPNSIVPMLKKKNNWKGFVLRGSTTGTRWGVLGRSPGHDEVCTRAFGI